MWVDVAAKYEEKEANTPSFSFFCDKSYSLFKDVDEITLFEKNVLEAFNLFVLSDS